MPEKRPGVSEETHRLVLSFCGNFRRTLRETSQMSWASLFRVAMGFHRHTRFMV